MPKTTPKAPKKAPIKTKAPKTERIAIISTSDRTAFRACRRRWNFSSHLRQSLHPMEQRVPLWFGSAMHHALEDFHGRKLYPNTHAAIDDYVQATVKYYGEENIASDNIEDDVTLMKRMLSHYQHGWLTLRKRDPLKTYTVDKTPQVEIPFEFEIPLPAELLRAAGYTKAIYRGVLDRVVIDEDGYLWIQDYKNVARFTPPEHLELDSQIDVYLWAASYIFKRPVIGFIYTQFKKSGVEPPRVLKDGTISVDSSQNTSHALYRKALENMYGDGSKNLWPEKNVTTLNYLASLEEEEADKFIRRDRVSRNKSVLRAAATKIIAEVTDMLNPATAIYPNPVNFPVSCSASCSFLEPCLRMDRGEDYKTILADEFVVRPYEDRNEWRKHLQVGEKTDKERIYVKGTTTP